VKKIHIISGLLLLNAVLISCSKWDDVIVTPPKQYDLAFSVGHQNGMRMANDVVQADNSFRGLEKLWVIPFETTDAVAVTANSYPLLSIATGTEANKVDDQDYYYIGRCSLKQGTNRVLVYGQAKPIEGKESEIQNGKLETRVGEEIIVPKDITFSLQSIRETTDVDPKAQALANYLTAIANTDGWSTTDNSELKALYLDFIHADSDGTGLMAGSAAHVKAYVTELKTQLQAIGGDLSNAIIAVIDDETLSACLNNGYPSASTSLGIPDGSAALRWIASDNAFSVRTQTTTLDNINGINRYTYPAELWYYVNSTIKTSEKEVGLTKYQQTSNWNTLLAEYDEESVAVTTKSAAVVEPLQYGVARLQMTLETISGQLTDSKYQNVSYGSAANLPLTAVIVGGQHTVGFDFKPMEPQSNVDARFIYDPVVGTSGTVNTLVFQTYDEEKVPVILELENKTGQKFTGKDGVIYPDTKFYLIGEIDPAGQGAGAYANRVFTQDYTTKVTMTVTSLENAYSCMPDLLSPRLEVGVQVQTKWVLSTPTAVKL
jgi:hypothetical protein